MVNRKELIQGLRSLGLPWRDFAVCGSSVLLGHDMVDEVHDIDLIAFGKGWEQTCGISHPRQAPMGDQVVAFRDGMFEVYSGLSFVGEHVQDLISEADVIEGFKFVRLKRIRLHMSKIQRGQSAEHIALIDGYLGSTIKCVSKLAEKPKLDEIEKAA